MRQLILVALSACYRPAPPAGAPCGPNASCPSPLVCAPNGVCEGTELDARASNDARVDARPDGGPTVGVQWVKIFVESQMKPAGPAATFMASATNLGDAIVVQLSCTSSTPPTAISISAPNWTFTTLSPIFGSSSTGWAASVVAIAPDTATASFTVQWAGASCVYTNEIGDEFTNNDRTGGTVTFDGYASGSGVGDCASTLTTGSPDEAVWGACTSQTTVTAVGMGYTKSADDGAGDWTEYRLTTDPVGTVETVRFRNTNTNWFVTTSVAIKPR